MAKRSLKATPLGIAKAKQAFQRTGWTQEYLASEVGLETRQSIWKFFSGRPVERHIFIDICFRLDLDWEDIAEPPEVEPLSIHLANIAKKSNGKSKISQWVQQVKTNLSHQVASHCDALHSPLPLSEPLTVSQVYTKVNFTHDLNHQRWCDKDELEELFWQQATHGLHVVNHAKVSSADILSEMPRLVIVGNAGSGKTALLKHLALQCNQCKLQSHCIPLYISCQSLVKGQDNSLSLKAFIIEHLCHGGLSSTQAEAVLDAGRVFLMLDGLDEVLPNQAVVSEIKLLYQHYSNTPIVISHRATNVDVQFPGFRYVEILEFDDRQIFEFSQKWFMSRGGTQEQHQRFLEYLDDPQSLTLKTMARRPLVLTLLCIVFQKKERFLIGDFRLYRTIAELFIDRWNHIKGLYRSLVVSDIDIPAVVDWLASQMLESDQVFIEHQQLLDKITEYLTEEAQLDVSHFSKVRISKAILEVLLQQTGILVKQSQDIYAFTSLALQQYLAAQYLASTMSCQNTKVEINVLAEKIKSPLWIEAVFLLVHMIPQAFHLVTKIDHIINKVIKQDKTLHRLADGLDVKMEKLADHRDCDLIQIVDKALFHHEKTALTVNRESEGIAKREHQAVIFYPLLEIIDQLATTPTSRHCQQLINWLEQEYDYRLAAPFAQSIQTLKESLEPVVQNKVTAEAWWKKTGQSWAQEFIALTFEHCGTGLPSEQKADLQGYFQVKYMLDRFLNNAFSQTSSSDSPPPKTERCINAG